MSNSAPNPNDNEIPSVSQESPSKATTRSFVFKPRSAVKLEAEAAEGNGEAKEVPKKWCKAHIVRPTEQDAQCGFIFESHGHVEKKMCDPFFKRRQDKSANTWMCETNAVKLIVFPKPGGKDYNNKNGYPIKGICFMPDPETQLDDEFVRGFCKHNFIPKIMSLGGIAKEQKPNAKKMELAYYTHWGDIFDKKTLEDVWRTEVMPKGKTIGDWCRQSKANLYSLYRRGEVPAEVIEGWNLLKKHVDTQDYGHFAGGEDGASKRDADYDTDSSEEDGDKKPAAKKTKTEAADSDSDNEV